jgi:hypothetical protein
MRRILAILLSVTVWLVLSSLALAQDEWPLHFDFSQTCPDGWTVIAGVCDDPSFPNQLAGKTIEIQYDFSEPVTLSTVDIEMHGIGSSNSTLTVFVTINSVESQVYQQGVTNGVKTVTINQHSISSIRIKAVRSYVHDIASVTLRRPSMNLVKPFEPQHEEWGLADGLQTNPYATIHDTPEDSHVVVGFAEALSPVHVGMSGTVTLYRYDSIPGEYGGVQVPPSVHNSGTSTFSYSVSASGRFEFGYQSYWKVVIYNDECDCELHYWVLNADEFVESGATVSAGCIIGQALFFVGTDVEPGVSIGTDGVGVEVVATQDYGLGGTFVIKNIGGSEQELLPEFVTDPGPGQACNESENQACLGDSKLEHSSMWDTNGGVSFSEGGGATLDPGASISATMNLDPVREPTMLVSSRTVASSGSMTLGIGNTLQAFSIDANMREYQLPGSVHSPDAGLFFSVLVENDSDVLVEVDYVCIAWTKNADGTSITDPLDPDGDGTTDAPESQGPFHPSCDATYDQPGAETLVDQIGWHWHKSEQFFQCDLMQMLNDMYDLGQDSYRRAGWSIRWNQNTALMYADWLSSDVIFWLNGHFANMANGRQTFVEVNAEGDTCNNLFCMVESFFGAGVSIFDGLADLLHDVLDQVLAPIVDLLSTIIGDTVSFIFSLLDALVAVAVLLIGEILKLFGRAGDLLGLIISAWNNSTPETIPGIPTCSTNPQGQGFCIAIWMMDNTVFSGPGELIVPMLIGYGTILLILSTIGDIKKTLIEAGRVT